MAAKSGGKTILGRSVSRLQIPVGQKFCQNCSVMLCFGDKRVFLRFTQKFKIVAKSGGKTFFCKKSPVDSADTVRVKNFIEISLSCSVSEINAFFLFYANSRWPPKVAGKRFFGKIPVDSADTLRIKNFIKIAVSCSVPEINMFFAFYAEIQDGRQKWRENDFAKSCQ